YGGPALDPAVGSHSRAMRWPKSDTGQAIMRGMTRRAPEGLSGPGRKFWADVVRTYELSPAELLMLHRCCVSVESLAAVDAEIAGQGISVKGSRGQVIPNRLIKLRCEMERVLDVQVRSLQLPLPGEAEGRRRSPAAAAAAYTRWAASGG